MLLPSPAGERPATLVGNKLISEADVEVRAAAQLSAAADLAAAEASVQTADLNLSFTRVTAPLAGRASYRRLAPGNLVNADTMLRPNQPALVVEDMGFDTMGATPAAGVSPASQQYMMTAPPEAPYSVWNVLGLLCCVFVLAIVGMLMTDLMRNMWAFDTERVVSTGLMDSLLSAIGMN